MRGIHRGPVNSLHKWPVTRKMFPFDDVIMSLTYSFNPFYPEVDDLVQSCSNSIANALELLQSSKWSGILHFAKLPFIHNELVIHSIPFCLLHMSNFVSSYFIVREIINGVYLKGSRYSVFCCGCIEYRCRLSSRQTSNVSRTKSKKIECFSHRLVVVFA